MEVKVMLFLIFLSQYCLAQTNSDALDKILQEIEIDRSVWNEKVNTDTIIDVYDNARIDTNKIFKHLPNRIYLQKLIDAVKLPLNVQDSTKTIGIIKLFQKKYFEEYEPTKYQYEYLVILSNLVGVIYLDVLVKDSNPSTEILAKLKKQTILKSEKLDSFVLEKHKILEEKKYDSIEGFLIKYNASIISPYKEILSNKFDFIIKTRIILTSIEYCLFKLGDTILPTVNKDIEKAILSASDYRNSGKKNNSSYELDWIFNLVKYYERINITGLYNIITSHSENFQKLFGIRYTFNVIGREIIGQDYSSYRDLLLNIEDINELRDRYEAMCSTPQGREKTKDFLIKVIKVTNSANIENLYLGFTFCYDKEVESFLKSQKRKEKSKPLKEYIENIISHAWEYGVKVNY